MTHSKPVGARTQNFSEGPFFSYDFPELVAFWRDSKRAMQVWRRQHPDWVVTRWHEALLAEPRPHD